MVKAELKRALHSKAFVGTILLVLLLLAEGDVDYLPDLVRFVTGSRSRTGLYIEKFLDSFLYGTTCYLVLCYPIVVVLSYVLSYRKERDSGFRQLMVLKSSKWTYRRAKIAAVACTGFLSLSIPLLFWLFVCRFVMGTGGSIRTNYMTFLLQDLYESRPFLYGLCQVLNAGVQGAVFALFALGTSAVIGNRYVGALLPFCYLIFSSVVLERYWEPLNAVSLLMLNNALGIGGNVGYDIVLALAGCVLFVGGDEYVGKA